MYGARQSALGGGLRLDTTIYVTLYTREYLLGLLYVSIEFGVSPKSALDVHRIHDNSALSPIKCLKHQLCTQTFPNRLRQNADGRSQTTPDYALQPYSTSQNNNTLVFENISTF